MCARLFRLEPTFFTRLRAECLALDQVENAHRRAAQTPVRNWIGHYGMTTQVMLSRVVQGPRAAAFPTIHAFLSLFPHLHSMKLNGLTPGSGVPAHKEPTLQKDGSLRARFHLPLVTNPGAVVRLGDELFHFEEASIYFFNKGAPHGAHNGGDADRFHVVWDMDLSPAAYQLMFDAQAPAPESLHRVALQNWIVVPVRTEPLQTYKPGGPCMDMYKRLNLARWGVPELTFCRAYERIAGCRPRAITFAASR